MSNNIKHNLHNTHSWNRLLHRFRGHLELAVRCCKWWGTGLCVDSWLRKSGLGSGWDWALLCHTNTMLKEFNVYKTSKFPPAVLSCNIHVDTIETTMSSFSRVFMTSLAVKGSGPGRVEDFTPLLAVAFQGRWHRFSTLLPCVRGSGGWRLQLESMIKRRFNSSASAVFDQTSYLGVTSHFTK